MKQIYVSKLQERAVKGSCWHSFKFIGNKFISDLNKSRTEFYSLDYAKNALLHNVQSADKF